MRSLITFCILQDALSDVDKRVLGASPNKRPLSDTTDKGVSCTYTLEIHEKEAIDKAMSGIRITVGDENREKRSIKVCFRVNEKEAEWIKNEAWKCRMSAASFIRNRVFLSKRPQISEEVKVNLHGLNYQINRIGNNINQITRSFHVNGSLTNQERNELITSMRKVEGIMDDITKKILGDGIYGGD